MDIKIHDEIGQWGVSARDVLAQLSGLTDQDTVNLSIHSPGGDMFDGLAIYNALKASPARVVATVEGLAASAASLIAMAADEIRMPGNAYMMIHNPWGFVGGDAAVMAEAADLFDRWANTTAAIYAKRAGITVEAARALQDQTVWMDGTQAQESGFCDEVVDALPSIKAFARMPQCLATDCPVQFEQPEPPPAEEPPADPPADEPPSVEPPAEEPPAVNVAEQAAEIAELCNLAGQPARAAAFIREGKTAEEVRGVLAKIVLDNQAPAAASTAPDVQAQLEEAAKTNMTVRSLLARNQKEKAVQYLKVRN